ncbi:superfamily II DNA or RNA helicase [Mycobacterium sp. OAS707]|uniref:DEAD/DEAH box helicase n=1 Tax=Mycobacterium sp. OAS707 TaxID=2663822 RepID=UPI001788F8D7|nr:DEAD/DEAH box helicase [Mycobacterium sp. OAS707]MBE1548130.1 superfamily II DNA or RNA helicase [Mycobacterium sp. OAS707]
MPPADSAGVLRRALSRHFAMESSPWDEGFFDEEDSADVATVGTHSLDLVRSSLRPRLFDYQRDLVTKFVACIESGRSGLLSLPTGGGKTRTAVVACLDSFSRNIIHNAIWLAPTRELVEQAQLTFVDMWKAIGGCPDIRIDRGFRMSRELSVCVTTPQEVYARLQKETNLGAWDAVIFDEAHQLGARTYEQSVRALCSQHTGYRSQPTGLIGLSATPGRTAEDETSRLVDFFGGHLITSSTLGANPVLTLQRRGVLARLEFRSLTKREIPVADEVSRLRIAITACQQFAMHGRRVMVFTQSVEGAECLAAALWGLEVPAASVSSKLPAQRRFSILAAFGEGRIQVLANQRLLATGYDCPAVSDVLLLGPVGSPILFEQMVGRAARGPKTGGSALARVWDFDDHLAKYGIPSSYYRYRDYDWSRN